MLKFKEIFKNKKYLFLIAIILLGTIFIIKNNSNNKLNDLPYIEKVLANKYYKSLPDVAKDYIRDIYNETGEVLKVNANKEENEPYLNPDYIEYLEYKEDLEKSKDVGETSYEVIPNETIIDYVYNEATATSNENLPSSFDLRNVDGKNYTTPLKNQGDEGLCWAYTSSEQIESKIMIDKNEPYNEITTPIISPKYYDYATSYSIIDYAYLKNGSSRRKLTNGGNFRDVAGLAVRNLGVVTTDWDYNVGIDNKNKEANTVYSFANSLYDVDETINYPSIDFSKLNMSNDDDYNIYRNYIEGLKKVIMDNGGAYLSGNIAAGNYGCSVEKPNGNIFIGLSNGCKNTGNHAEQLIGWDDNFEYQYCRDKDDEKENLYDVTSNDCLENSTVIGKGAWLIRNSWGNSKYSYYYIPYLTNNLSFHSFTKLNNKNWDNYYGLNYDYVYDDETFQFLFKGYSLGNTTSTPQKIVKFKIDVSNQNEKQYLYFGDDYNSLEKIAEYDVNYPGYYTIDLSEKNIILNPNTKYYLRIVNSDNVDRYSIMSDNYLFTNNVNDSTSINLEDFDYTAGRKTNKKGYYQIRASGITENLSEGSLVDFKVFDENNNEINNVTYSENDVFANLIFANVYIPKTIDISKEYTLKAYYNNELKSTSRITFEEGSDIGGNGTKEDPYQITNSKELRFMEKDSLAYYVLMNDIDLTYDTQDKKGLFYNYGYGWYPIDGFSGQLDGQNHTIKGLYSKKGGLFGSINGKTSEQNRTISIKNIKMSDVKIEAYKTNYKYEYSDDDEKNYENYLAKENKSIGALVNSFTYIYEHTHEPIYDARFVLSNISILNGEIKENINECYESIKGDEEYNECYLNIGGIIGNINYSSVSAFYPEDGEIYEELNNYIGLNNLYNGVYIENTTGNSGGIVGHISYNSSYIPNYFKNLQNVATINGKNYAGGIIGSITDMQGYKGGDSGTLLLSNIINIGSVISDNKYADIFNENELSDTDEYSCYHCNKILSLKNIYYTGDNGINVKNFIVDGDNYNNVAKKTVSEIRDANYDDWEDFSTYWKSKGTDNIKRVPMLKNSNFEYISLSANTINIPINEYKYVYDYINPSNENVKNSLTYDVINSDIVEVTENGLIKPKSTGSTTITIHSDYDGYEGSINIVVGAKEKGTIDNPVEIKNTDDLGLLRDNPSDSFIIINDIDMSGIEWEPVENFNGYLNGNNHIIKNLTTSSPTMQPYGFFRNLTTGASVRNIIFDNVNVYGWTFVGTLAGRVTGDNITISNIIVLNGSLGPTEIGSPYIGGIIGYYSPGNNNILKNLYNGASIIKGQYAGGIIGYFDGTDNKSININNIMNRGTLNATYTAGLIGKINSNEISITNAFQLGIVNGSDCSDDIVCTIESSNPSLNNIYFVNDSNYKNDANNVSKKTVEEIVNADYSSWTNFSTNFKQETKDNIKRIPLLKDVNIDYVKLSKTKFNLGVNDNKSIFDYLTPNNDYVKKSFIFDVVDNSIVEINNDGVIHAKKVGETTINIISSYDGYENTVSVKVFDKSYGTEEEPWKISSVDDLDLLREESNDYFVITDDIDLSGIDWKSISGFKGHLDGGNHKIKNLKIYDAAVSLGFFDVIEDNAEVKNLIFEDVDIHTLAFYTGTLAGRVAGDNVTISNISVLNGTIDSDGANNGRYIGGIIGLLNAKENNNLTNLYNGANIKNNEYGAGIIGFISGLDNNYVYIENIMNHGMISATRAAGLVGVVDVATLNVYNALQLGMINGVDCSDDITCDINDTELELNHIYFVNDSSYKTNKSKVYTYDVSKKTIKEIVNANYNIWYGFSDSFKQDIIDGIKRIPLLNNVNIEYTKLKQDKIELEIDQQYNIYDLLDTENDNVKNITYSISDTSIASIDNNGIITGIKVGTTKVTIDSNWDGFSKDVDIEILTTGVVCLDGEYLPEHSKSCTKCPEGYYCPNNNFIYTGEEQGKHSCPNGYTSDTGAKSETNCYINVDAGKYKITSTGSTVSSCSAGTSKDAHKSYYNEEDSCNICALGSYSTEGASSCTICTNGKTTSGTGKTSCDVECTNTIGVNQWVIPTWDNNTVTNLCKVNSCSNGYIKEENTCTPIKLTIEFDANGGTGTMESQEIIKNQKLKLNTFEKDDYKFKHWNTKADDSGNSYEDLSDLDDYINTLESNGSLKLYAIWEKEIYPIENGYIMDISKNTQTSIFKEKIEKTDDEEVKVYDNDDNELESNRKVYTGSVTKIYKNNVAIKTYTNIVLGDTNRDGDMDLSDVAKLYSKVMKDNIEDDLISLSGDANKDKNLDISDVAKIFSYYMKNKRL